MIGVFLADISGAAGAGRPSIRISSTDSDDDAAPGQAVATLSIVNDGRRNWTFTLKDDAGGMFAISDAKLNVGPSGLDHDRAPAPGIAIEATDGRTVLTRTVVMNVRRPLPVLPLAVGAKVAAIGDSYTGFNNYTGGAIIPAVANAMTVNATQSYGFIEWARALDPRFAFDTWYDPADPTGRNISGANQGVFSDHLEFNTSPPIGIIPRVPALLAHRPDVLILQGGTNTINSGDISGRGNPGAFADIVAKLDKGLRLARNEGVWTILKTLYLRADWPARDPRYKTLAAVNSWIRAQAGREGLLAVLDANATLSPNGVSDPTMFQPDKVHLSPKGALLLGRDYLLPVLRGAIAAGTVFDMNPATANLYPATVGKLAGAGGVKNPGVTGEVADGLRVSISRNASAVLCSKADLGGGLSGQVLDITPADSNSAAYGEVDILLPQLATNGLIAAGDWIYHAIFIEQLSGQQLGTARAQFQLRNAGTAVQTAYAMNTSSAEFAAVVPTAGGWWMKTNPMQVPAGVTFTNLLTTLGIYFPKSGTPFQIRLSRPIMRKAGDPRPAWGYAG